MEANDIIYPELVEGEQILWAGKPEKVSSSTVFSVRAP